MANDLSFNIIALDNASKTFIKLSEQVERFALRLDKLDRKDVNVNVNVKTDKAIGSIDLLESRFQKLAAGVVSVSGFAGPAIIGGIGAGFIAIAAIAQKSNAEIRETYQLLWRNVAATTKNATDQLVPQIAGAGRAIDAEFQTLGPDLERAFSFAGPDIVALTNGLNTLAHNVMPGLNAVMKESLPVMEGFSSLMGQLGTSAGNTLTELSKHSDEFGISVQSLGGVTSAALGAASTIVIDLNHVWAENAGGIVSSAEGIGESITGVANGAVPLLSAGLQVLTGLISGVTDILGPVAPLLGTVGTVALATWGAFKVASIASTGVNILATGVMNLGANMQVGAVRAAGYVAAQRGVAVQASATATALTAAGAATARASIGFAAAASSLAGPIGLAITGGAILFGLLSDSQDKAAESSLRLAGTTDQLASAFIASHGAMNRTTDDALLNSDSFKAAADAAKTFGISQADVFKAIVQGGPTLDEMRAKLQAAAEAIMRLADSGDFELTEDPAKALKAFDEATKAFTDGQQRAREYSAAQVEVGTVLLRTAEYQDAASGTARALGLSLGEVSGGFRIVVATGTAASTSTTDVAAAFIKTRLAMAQAQTSVTDHFVSADKAVISAQSSLRESNHSLAGSARAVADAQHSQLAAQRSLADARHSELAAQRSLADAQAGVGVAQQAIIRATEDERRAQLSLNEARQQAIEDLKEMHAQLEGQVVSEGQARLRLFDAIKSGDLLGVNPGNAREMSTQTITEDNEEQIRAALDVLSAQNSLNQALHSGQKLRADVAKADAAGVEGAQGVIAAQEALVGAHEQVTSASSSLVKAQRQVEEADYSLKRSHQAVEDAAYSLRRAHQAVEDAEYNRERSAERVTAAQQSLRDAQDQASRSLDINTKAGQENLRQIMTLWAAIEASGMPTQDRFNALVGQTASVFGMSTDAAALFLAQLGLIPKDFKYNVTAVAGADLQAITQQTINGVKVFTSSLGSGGIASAGRLASGGPVVGMGGPRDDANLIWASHGEYMQPADAVSYYGAGVMEAIRQKKLRIVGSDGAALPGYAKGGMIEAFAAYANLATAYVSDVNTLGVMGMPHPAQLPVYVAPVAAVTQTISPGSFIAGRGVAQWTPQILQALSMLGQSADWLPVVQRRMNQESGGNPTVVNRWDSNWQRGTPSVGLMQVIGPTFAHNAGPFAGTGPFLYGTSVDPLANIYSGLNYAIHRYGSLSALNRPGGYDNGGQLQPGWTPVFNGTGRPENVRSAAAEDKLLDALKSHRPVKNFILNAHVSDRGLDVREQFRRMEALERR